MSVSVSPEGGSKTRELRTGRETDGSAFLRSASRAAGAALLVAGADMLLSDRNGFEILPELQALLGEGVAIVMMSPNAETALVQTCVRRGTPHI